MLTFLPVSTVTHIVEETGDSTTELLPAVTHCHLGMLNQHRADCLAIDASEQGDWEDGDHRDALHLMREIVAQPGLTEAAADALYEVLAGDAARREPGDTVYGRTPVTLEEAAAAELAITRWWHEVRLPALRTLRAAA